MHSIVSIADSITNIIDRIIPDPNERARAKAEFNLQRQQGVLDVTLAQLAINREEAKHESIFVSGWRPFIGWACGIAIVWHFIVYPIVLVLCSITGVDTSIFPKLNMNELMTIISSMLGLSVIRTFEKTKGVNKNR